MYGNKKGNNYMGIVLPIMDINVNRNKKKSHPIVLLLFVITELKIPQQRLKKTTQFCPESNSNV